MDSPKRSPRRGLVLIALALAAAVVSPSLAATAPTIGEAVPATVADGTDCTVEDPVRDAALSAGTFAFTDEPDAGTWATWYVPVQDVLPPPPPQTASEETAAELAELHEIALTRTGAEELKARSYDDGPVGKLWTELFLKLILEHSDKNGIKNPPTLSRQMGILHQGIFDALAATWYAKYCYERLPPTAVDPALDPVVPTRPAPSYPSEHAAVAGVAAVLMAHFWPPGEEPEGRFDRMAEEIAESRLWAGVNYRSDVEAGLALGYAVGERILAERITDGWDAQWDGSGRIEGPCNWTPAPYPNDGGPLLPLWGEVRPFLMTSGDQFRPPPPPACDGPDYIAQTRDLFEASKNLTDRQKYIAWSWAGGQNTTTPPGQWIHLALNYTLDYELNTMRQARVMAHVAAAVADGGIAAWDAKYAYWSDRPVTAIPRLGWDADWRPYIATPPFPGYVSGHSTFGGAATATLAYFFPDDYVELVAIGTDTMMSRFYGGIHIRADNELGMEVGENIAALAAARASQDGAE